LNSCTARNLHPRSGNLPRTYCTFPSAASTPDSRLRTKCSWFLPSSNSTIEEEPHLADVAQVGRRATRAVGDAAQALLSSQVVPLKAGEASGVGIASGAGSGAGRTSPSLQRVVGLAKSAG
jgi:hypothetical protein